ncbi:MAG: hypothetical protein IJK01_04300 [Clostridia bacterium]|nr:hypothetical protein [Clostridia bacterium]
MKTFDLDGDGILDPIELATRDTYYRELLHDDYNDAMIDETDDLTFSDDEYLLEPERD